MRKITPKVPEEVKSTEIGGMKPYFPSFGLGLEHIPEAKRWKLGETYNIEMKVKLTGLSQSRYQNSADFEIVEIGADDDNEDEDEE